MPVVQGYAIISREGMIAHADGSFPDVLKRPGDHQFFRAGVRAADAIIHGRNSGEKDAVTANRPRLILTREIASLAHDPANPYALRWNPHGAPFADAWQHLGVAAGNNVAAVLGGTDVFELFLQVGYDTFFLSCADVSLSAGRKVFAGPETPQARLRAHGLTLRSCRQLDAAPRVILETWHRANGRAPDT
ncbi:dihydrofolate reductase [Vineibacter terrae]|uniref:dihydrofolate reductase n=1 Tax=Vineibacter terrae TaxID=2586908 RepID=UPI002E310D2D|nr:dihydrofolate reductase [Vineibacter terrae]HEX2892067.1 dihydrofolate reductase [Vineibacter terrae]